MGVLFMKAHYLGSISGPPFCGDSFGNPPARPGLQQDSYDQGGSTRRITQPVTDRCQQKARRYAKHHFQALYSGDMRRPALLGLLRRDQSFSDSRHVASCLQCHLDTRPRSSKTKAPTPTPVARICRAGRCMHQSPFLHL